MDEDLEGADPMPSPGRLLARGRACDVFDLGDGTVLRRHRGGRDARGEGEVLGWAGLHGVPVPAVLGVDGPDLRMAHVPGPTLLEQLADGTSSPTEAGAVLVHLHRLLDEVPPLHGLPERLPRGGLPARTGLLHGDLHPGNVIAAAPGPVLIDWTNASNGPRPADVAESWLLIACFDAEADAGRPGTRSALLDALLAATDTDPRPWLPAVAATRLRDPGTTDDERRALTALLRPPVPGSAD